MAAAAAAADEVQLAQGAGWQEAAQVRSWVLHGQHRCHGRMPEKVKPATMQGACEAYRQQ